jgi:hypothetical protein
MAVVLSFLGETVRDERTGRQHGSPQQEIPILASREQKSEKTDWPNSSRPVHEMKGCERRVNIGYQEFVDAFMKFEELAERLAVLEKHLTPEIASNLIESGEARRLNFDSGIKLAYRITDVALETAIRELFTRTENLLYVTIGYCTESFNDENEPGLNTLVFGFFPEALKNYPPETVRNILSGEHQKLSSREKLAIQGLKVAIPTLSTKDYLENSKEFAMTEVPENFPEEMITLHLKAESWFGAYELYVREETSGGVQYWRDGEVTSI